MSSSQQTFICNAILFDLDGVLIDSTTCVERHWREWAGRHGLDPKNILRIAHGVRNVDTMRRIAPHLDVEREAQRFADDEAADTVGVVSVPGAASLLAGIPDGRWAIVTSCSSGLALARLQAARLPLPKTLVTGSDVTRGKPDPEPYLVAARLLEVAVTDCLVVEDAPAGIQSGKSAGMQVLGVAFTYGREQLRSSGADLVIDRLTNMTARGVDDVPGLIAVDAGGASGLA